MLALATGDPRKAVALKLGISIHTVDSHLRRAFGKLHCHAVVAAVCVIITGERDAKPSD